MQDAGKTSAPWHGRTPRPAPRVEVRRALDPDTGLTFGRLTILQKLKLKTMNQLIRPFVTKWLPRQLLKFLTIAAATIGATADQAHQTALFIAAAVSWLLEMGLSWLSLKWAKRNAPQA